MKVRENRVTALIEKGEEAYREHSLPLALKYFKNALERLGEEDKRYLDLLVYIGRARTRLGEWDAALGDFHRALELCKRQGRQELRPDILRRIGDILAMRSEWELANFYYKTGLEEALKTGNKKSLAELYNSIAIIHFERGEHDEALKFYRKSLRAARSIGYDLLTANIYNNLGAIYSTKGAFNRAIEFYKKSLRLSLASNDVPGIARAYHNLGLTYKKMGNMRCALNNLQRSLELSKKIGEEDLYAISLLDIADVNVKMGRIGRGIKLAKEAIAKLEWLGDRLGAAEGYKVLGVAYRELGRLDEAEEHLKRSIEIHEECDNPLGTAESYRELGITYKLKGENDKTWLWLEKSIQIFENLKARRDLEEARRELEEVERVYLDVVRELGSSVESKDRYTLGHSERVALYALELAKKLRIESDEIKAILTAAYLHDIGKIDIPDEILKKPGRLTDEEFKEIKKHPLFALKKIEYISFPWNVRPLIKHHHERYDGRGYPDGLKGKEIPLGARIIAVADTFDALTSDRPYRRAFSLEEALRELKRSAGTQLDPGLVELFLEILREKPELFQPRKLPPRIQIDFLWKKA